MMYHENSVATGNWLFARRGWLPISLFVLATVALLITSKDQIIHNDLILTVTTLSISVAGLIVRAITIGYTPLGTSGRNTKKQEAASLNTTGIYSVVRNPLYLGNFLMWMGITIYVGVDWFMIAVLLLFWIYYEKIVLAEEDFLMKKFGKIYLDWCQTTRAFIPGFSHFKRPNARFSLLNVIKREYHGVFYLVLSFIYIDLIKNGLVSHKWYVNEFWMWLGIAALIAAVIIRILVKKTNLLNVSGR